MKFHTQGPSAARTRSSMRKLSMNLSVLLRIATRPSVLNAVLPLSMTPARARPLQGLTVLIVDDHRDTVDLLSEYLTAHGATVVGAGSAKAALALTETHTLDVALVDLRMPGEDGWWLLRQLRMSRVPAIAKMPVFALSGEWHEVAGAVASADEFMAHFLKPVDLEALVARLSALRRRSR